MADAASIVFSTPELLELILLNLPHRDLLFNRRLSSTFNNLINSSPAIQQKLFFLRSPDATVNDWHANSVLRDLFLPFFVAPDGRFSSRDYSVLKALDWAKDEKTRKAFLRKEASWRKMALISHPPNSLRVVNWTHGQGGSSKEIACIQFESGKGVTMGPVYDIVHSFLVNKPVASFGVAFNQVPNKTTSKEIGKVEMTLYLDMTIQCCIDEAEDDKTSLRSEGEEMTVHGIELKAMKDWDEDDKKVPGMWDKWKSDLGMERGGLDEGEWEEWRSCRGE